MERTLRFDRGTLLLEHWPQDDVPPGFVFDARVNLHRAQANRYYDVVLDLHRRGIAYDDQARDYHPLERMHQTDRTPRDYQAEAVAAWKANGRRGTVILPTGAGKTFVAELCMADANRNTLVIAPTINLVGQWYDGLKRAFGEPVGILGGGVHEVHPITVSTYDSAHLHIERYGNQFGLLVFDEVHHLPGRSFQFAAEGAIAPFRLGLTATLERPDGAHERVFDLVGSVVYRKEITELEGEFLAPYTTERITVALSDADRIAYDEARRVWRSFIDEEGIRLGGRNGWNNYLYKASRSKRGRASMKAWRDSRAILQGAPAKLRMLDELLRRHRDRRVLVFTNDNATVHHISRTFLVPAITHHTDVKERRRWLDAFAEGSLRVLTTSRVLNEGVDIPAADVAIVLSGTGTVREHVQRLGRILRKQEGKQAILYEVVVEDTAEEGTSDRRRDHAAYRR